MTFQLTLESPEVTVLDFNSRLRTSPVNYSVICICKMQCLKLSSTETVVVSKKCVCWKVSVLRFQWVEIQVQLLISNIAAGSN